MANKALAKRQKMTIRVEPAPRSLKPRNPVAVAAKQRAAGSHRKSASAVRQAQNLLAKKRVSDTGSEDD
ncbi:hypothetical protein Q8A64_01555 [Oxalobacteraceae bacterium R-40]|uniref:Uncharacterized protein n=1 Tax=Keguizhuia sedimenti TaxID=3064264 RepID=A0ABU1BL88_9BURK|nr:hypothetical protein [Oxalobacteraceae bacterium R-40]